MAIGPTKDYNYIRHIGWSESNDCVSDFFSTKTADLISKKVTELTKGVDKLGRKIIVPHERIYEVMDGVYQTRTVPVGDIYSRYIVPNNEQNNLVQQLIDQSIEVITSHIRNELGMEEQNQTFNIWHATLLGDFNPNNLRQFPPLKIREKRPATMQFNMNY